MSDTDEFGNGTTYNAAQVVGHVLPGLAFMGAALALGIVGAAREEARGQAYFYVGLAIAVICVVGFLAEGGNAAAVGLGFAAQLGHEALYLSFLWPGLALAAERPAKRGPPRAPLWRWAFALSWLSFALVMYGHALEKEELESAMHFVSVILASIATLAFLWTAQTGSYEAFALTTMFANGAWFIVVAGIGAAPPAGAMDMDAYVWGALLFQLCVAGHVFLKWLVRG